MFDRDLLKCQRLPFLTLTPMVLFVESLCRNDVAAHFGRQELLDLAPMIGAGQRLLSADESPQRRRHPVTRAVGDNEHVLCTECGSVFHDDAMSRFAEFAELSPGDRPTDSVVAVEEGSGCNQSVVPIEDDQSFVGEDGHHLLNQSLLILHELCSQKLLSLLDQREIRSAS